MKYAPLVGLGLALCMPLSAWSAPPRDEGVNAEIRREMVDARKEIRTELAQARRELETDNLALGSSLSFGKDGRRRKQDDSVPKAEITPTGDFLIDGRQVEVDTRQRQHLLAYRGLVIEIAQSGIDIGERTALAAVDAVDRGLFSLMVGAMTGSLERRIEKTVREHVEPGVRGICRRLPALLDTQQQLAQALPAFQPYATLEPGDAESCEREFSSQFASR